MPSDRRSPAPAQETGEGASSAATPEPAAGAKRRPQFRTLLAKPFPFLVKTLIVVGLSALLIPAFTRQWDDRQKARELKASVVADMAATTAGALTAGRSALFPRKCHFSAGPDLGPITPAEKEWSIRTIQIAATLRSYFSQQIVNDWLYYSGDLEAIFQLLVGPAYQRGSLPPFGVTGPGNIFRGLFDPVGDSFAKALVAQARYVHDRHCRGHPEDVSDHYVRFERQIVLVETEVANEVLAAHPAGYSTSPHDLLRDLVP